MDSNSEEKEIFVVFMSNLYFLFQLLLNHVVPLCVWVSSWPF